MNHRTSPSSSRLLKYLQAGLVVAAVLPLLSCSNDVTSPSELQGAWRLRSMTITGGAAFEPDDPGRFTIEFHPDGRIGVVADCNQCGGSFSLEDDDLTVTPMACTLVACPTPRGEQFLSLIQGRSEVDTDGEAELEIESDRGSLELTR
jgi:heat shock protein HslJ